jgi:hypothetical protein
VLLGLSSRLDPGSRLCWVVVLAFAAAGMWLAHSAFRRSIK